MVMTMMKKSWMRRYRKKIHKGRLQPLTHEKKYRKINYRNENKINELYE